MCVEYTSHGEERKLCTFSQDKLPKNPWMYTYMDKPIDGRRWSANPSISWAVGNQLFFFQQLGATYFMYAALLDASSHLYMRSCPSVGRSVRRSVRPSVGPCVTCFFFLKAENEPFFL